MVQTQRQSGVIIIFPAEFRCLPSPTVRKFQRALLTLFLGAVLCLVTGLPLFAIADSLTPLTWADLLTSSSVVENPFEDLTPQQRLDIGELERIGWLITEGKIVETESDKATIIALQQKFSSDGINSEQLLEQIKRWRQARTQQSITRNTELAGSTIQLPGYVLPLTRDAQKQLTSFLLVPYIGACSHVPPPPSNQIVWVKTDTGIIDPGAFAPVMVEGMLFLDNSRHDIFRIDGTVEVPVGYTLLLADVRPYQPPAGTKVAQPIKNVDHTWWQSLQVRLSGLLSETLINIRAQRSLSSMMWGLVAAFAYGVLHTLGPGHGKAVIASYFVGRGGSWRRGVRMGIRIAFYHVLSAITIALLTHWSVRAVTGNTLADYHWIRLASYSAITLIGGGMLAQALGSSRRHRPTANKLAAAQLLSPNFSDAIKKTSSRAIPSCHCFGCQRPHQFGGWLAFAVGAVPCSGALLVLLYGLTHHSLWPSLLMVFAISVGMALTLIAIGSVALLTRRVASRQKRFGPFSVRRIEKIFQICGAMSVLVIGISLFSITLATG
ncbi:MAG: DUF3299 domain-containing protein [Cyanobacteria bacterium P01_H01_bin.15]